MRALWNTLHLGWEETEPPSEEMALDFLPVEPPSPLGIISEATTMCGPMNLGIGRTASVMNRGALSLLGQLLGPSFGPGSTPPGWPYRQTPGMAEESYHLVTTPVLGLTFWSHAGHLLLMAAPSWLHLHGCAFMAAPSWLRLLPAWSQLSPSLGPSSAVTWKTVWLRPQF